MNRMIAIIEDDPAEAQSLRTYFSRLASETEDNYDIRWFQTGREFLSAYQPSYDLVMMDINLPDLNGLDVASSLRKPDRDVVLIFVTSMAQ